MCYMVLLSWAGIFCVYSVLGLMGILAMCYAHLGFTAGILPLRNVLYGLSFYCWNFMDS